MSVSDVVSIISSIITLVDFSQNVLNRAAILGTNRENTQDPFRAIHALLPPISGAIRRTKERIVTGEINEETSKELIPIHSGVERILKELKNILEKCTPKEGASRAEVLWKAGKSALQEKKVNGILQRLTESYVSVLTLSYIEVTREGAFSLAEKENIRQSLAIVARTNTRQAVSLQRKCRNLLSLDGGGLRGLSILYILQDLMAKVNKDRDLRLKPCEVFDLIGGSGTGG